MSTVAVLGTGLMGEPMATNLAKAGLAVRAWNRTPAKARPLAEHGVTVAETAAEAARGADIVLTMLSDGATVKSVMADGVLDAVTSDGLWLQMSTVGVAATEELAALAENAGVPFVDAPVLGTRQPAEQGTLTVLASGPDDVRERCAPVFDAVGARTLWLGPAGAASKLKLVANSWVLAVTNGVAESIALANTLGVDPRQFLEAISGGGLDLPYAHVKGGAMIKGEYPASFSASLAAKDARLVLEAAGEHADLGGIAAALAHLEAAEQAGHGEDDMAALYTGVRRTS
jgi:3-hydroxyisobutyrate dehydrogenase